MLFQHLAILIDYQILLQTIEQCCSLIALIVIS